MASKRKISTPLIRVAVCGLISSSYSGLSGQGAGKSCLCNRFVQSSQDKFNQTHNSVLNLSEFGSNVINYTHFVYWGEKVTTLEDGQEVKFQVSPRAGTKCFYSDKGHFARGQTTLQRMV